MDRRSFFKRLVLAALAPAVIPDLLKASAVPSVVNVVDPPGRLLNIPVFQGPGLRWGGDVVSPPGAMTFGILTVDAQRFQEMLKREGSAGRVIEILKREGACSSS